MALRRSVFTVTCGSDGNGYDDNSLSGVPVNSSRPAMLHAVTIDVRAAVLKPLPSVTVTALNDVSSAAWNDTAEDYELSDQIYFVDTLLDYTTYPSKDEVYEYQLDSATGRALINEKHVRCEVTNGGASDVYTVTLYYETAGDYRF